MLLAWQLRRLGITVLGVLFAAHRINQLLWLQLLTSRSSNSSRFEHHGQREYQLRSLNVILSTRMRIVYGVRQLQSQQIAPGNTHQQALSTHIQLHA